MTQHPHLTDDDLSAHLDGVADAEVAARIAADPAATARLAELRDAAAAVGAPVVPLASATVDDLIGRALAAADADVAPVDPRATDAAPPADTAAVGVEPPNVVPLAPPRGRSGSGAPRWLVAAAVVVALAVGVGLVWSGQRGSGSGSENFAASTSDSLERSPDDGGTSSGGADTAADESPSEPLGQPEAASPHGVPTTAADAPSAGDADSSVPAYAAPLPYLGDFADADALRVAVGARFPATATTTTPGGVVSPAASGVQRCAIQLQQTLSNDYTLAEPADHVGLATVAGETVLVYEFGIDGDGDGAPIDGATALVLAVRPDACDQVAFIQR